MIFNRLSAFPAGSPLAGNFLFSAIFGISYLFYVCFPWYHIGMDVYLEFVILDNAAVTYFIARLAYRMCSMKRSRKRIIAACVVGTAFALTYPFAGSDGLAWVARISSYLCMCAILFAGRGKIVLPSLAFLLITFCFGGAAFAIGFAATGSADKALNARAGDIPVFAAAGGVALVYGAIKKVCATAVGRREIGRFTYDFSFRLYGKELTFRGLIDTGNALKSNGVGVAIVNADALVKKLDAAGVLRLATGENTKSMSVRTAAGEGKITLLPAIDFVIYIDGVRHILYDVAVGTSRRMVGEGGKYDALLPAGILDAVEGSKEVDDETEKTA